MIADIPIVVIGYNRPQALERLLHSLSRADYRQEVTLYISLDGSGDDLKIGRLDDLKIARFNYVAKVAEAFNWKHGKKVIIQHEKNLGLREHVLSCGDLSAKHDALIALEDDLVVSPGFYEFALQAYQFYKGDPNIGGISLYHHAYNETAQFPFIPLADGSDVYFLQYASSWGQVWTKEHWGNFRKWYDKRNPDDKTAGSILPPNIRLWPENSWKKFFIEFLIRQNRYFVYPRNSMTTIFGDEGTNIRIRETFLQVPLWHGERPFNFIPLKESSAVYDTYCEILPDRLKRLMKEMEREDFEVDLYGMKPSDALSSKKIISGRKCKSPERSFGREMKPHEENLINKFPGNYFSFGRKEDFQDLPYLARLMKCHEKKELSYWYPIRDYHFYRRSLLTTDKKSFSPADPLFLMKKFSTTTGYAFRYFFGKKK